MPKLDAVRSANAALKLASKHYLILGGTSGIGEHTALALAAQQPSKLTIVGRNEQAAKSILERLQTLNPSGVAEFHRCDLSLISDIKRFAKDFIAKHETLDAVIWSAGILSMRGRTETTEGHDVKMVTHYYGRWCLVDELAALLEATAALPNRNVRVVTVLDAGRGGPVPKEDLDLKSTFSLKKAMETTTIYNDLFVEEFALRHPSLSTVHMFPGAVDTPLMSSLPLPLRVIAKVMSPLLTKPEDCGQFVAYAATTPSFPPGSWNLLNNKADRLSPSKHHTEEARKRVWEHSASLVGSVSPPA